MGTEEQRIVHASRAKLYTILQAPYTRTENLRRNAGFFLGGTLNYELSC
jgi:hypothetical protein